MIATDQTNLKELRSQTNFSYCSKLYQRAKNVGLSGKKISTILGGKPTDVAIYSYFKGKALMPEHVKQKIEKIIELHEQKLKEEIESLSSRF